MWPLIRDFFTTKSAAVRFFRIVTATLGALVASQPEWLTFLPEWMGYLMTIVAGGTTQQPEGEKADGQN
jgi:hypothetical protein